MNYLKLIPVYTVYIVYIVSLVISEAQTPPLEQTEKRREERNREKRRRKAIEARLSSSGFNSARPFPCFCWHSSWWPFPSVLGEFRRNAQLCLRELGLLFQGSWHSSPAFTARCYEGDPARHCRHAPSHSQPLAWGIVSEESILGNTFLLWFVLFLHSEDWLIVPMLYHFTARETGMNFVINFNDRLVTEVFLCPTHESGPKLCLVLCKKAQDKRRLLPRESCGWFYISD